LRTFAQRSLDKGGESTSIIIVGSTKEAADNYFRGDGSPAEVGSEVVQRILVNPKFQFKHGRIINGLTSSKQGNFGVDLTGDIFHIGDTRVDYSVQCSSTNCSVTYQFFNNDGFWDVDFISETGNIFPADNMGPRYELPLGNPYSYIPQNRTFNFPKPRNDW
jgi:hypothetical protein